MYYKEIHKKLFLVNDSFFQNSILLYISSVCIAALATGFLIPYVRSIALRYNIVDQPNKRKQHKKEIVRLGGVAIIIGYAISLLSIYLFGAFSGLSLEFAGIIIHIFLASVAFFLIGLFDDIFSLSPFLRLILQLLISSYLWGNGIRIDLIDLSWTNIWSSYIELPNVVSWIITLLWISGITNAINWIDGLDGLAAGSVAISSLGIIVVGLKLNQTSCIFLITALIGSCLGFLRFNYNPARIIMGDSGSYFIGSTISISSLLTCNSNTFSNLENINILRPDLLLLLLFIPIFDMIYVISSRLYNGQLPFYPDRSHIHHQMLRAGFNTKNTVELIYLFTFLFCLIAILIS